MDETPKKRLIIGGKGKLRGKDGVSFSKKNQPSSEIKKAGWDKRKRGQQLVKDILNFTPDKKSMPKIKEVIATFFGCDVSDITIEEIMNLRQIHKAIQMGDTIAFKALTERAYGQAKQSVEHTGSQDNPVVITGMQIISTAMDVSVSVKKNEGNL